MTYKVLLTGTADSVIDFCFDNLENDFDLLTSSVRTHDFEHHCEVFQPHVVLYCISNGDPEEFPRIEELLRWLPSYNRPGFGILGVTESGNAYHKQIIDSVDFDIPSPFTVGSIRDKIQTFMTQRSKQLAAAAKQADTGASAQTASVQHTVAPAQQAAPSAPAASQAAAKPAEPAAPHIGVRKHILCIDDDPLVLKVLREHLRDKYDVAVARSGEVAYRYLEEKRIDMILIDYEMPGENGPSVLMNIRKMRFTENVPAVFLTGVTDKAAIAEAVQARPQGYLLKPIDREKLLAKVKEILGY